MAGIEIFLIFLGIITIVCSFVFAEKLEKNEENLQKNGSTGKAFDEEMVKKQVDRAIDEAIDDKVEDTEARMDKMSNEKILAMGDYYKTVSDEITQNHNEVMFLYGMLNDKEKDIKNAVRDVENLKKSIIELQNGKSENSSINIEKDNIIREVNTEKNNYADNNSGSIENSKGKKQKKSPTEGTQVKALADIKSNVSKKGVALSKKDIKKNNNEKILKLYNEGKTNVEIAKILKVGVGEVRLVIDLYKNR